MRILVTGASGTAGVAVCRQLAREGAALRMADMAPLPADLQGAGEFVRCDTRTQDDVRRAVQGVDAVVHLAAWHCAHVPPVSDHTIFAVNVDGTFHVLEACREFQVKSIVYASSMAYGYGSVYSLTKVIGEDMCRSYHEMTGTPIAMLRYHDFVPKPYLAFGIKLLRNGVDRRDVAAATVAALHAGMRREIGLFRTIVHTDHGMSAEVAQDFRRLGPDWCESRFPGTMRLLEKYGMELPDRVEQHDLSEAARLIGWKPEVGFVEFARDLAARDAHGKEVKNLWAPGQLPDCA